MDPTGSSEGQKQALMDLLVLGMYADHNLTSAEDACIGRLLESFQFSSKYDRQKFSDAAFTRASRHTGTPEAMQTYVTKLAANFSTPELRRYVYDTVNDLLNSDGKVTPEESQFLSMLREAFDL